jgi:hypothetical protein
MPRELASRHDYTSKLGLITLSWPDGGQSCTLGVAPPPAPPPELTSVTEYLAQAAARREEVLVAAEREAHASGKQPFDYAYLRARCPVGDEATARYTYFVSTPELRSLDELARHLTESAARERP